MDPLCDVGPALKRDRVPEGSASGFRGGRARLGTAGGAGRLTGVIRGGAGYGMGFHAATRGRGRLRAVGELSGGRVFKQEA